ncbi:MAG TPA: S1C family serine protease [Gemmatimonadaceae bacterium]|nr:S1C family serine protease [Gemmatimonadaceae bacterium]
MSSTLEALSTDLADAVERAGRSVVAIHARRRIPASGILWRDGLVVAADHTVQKEDDVRITLADGETRASVAGRDPSTDLCILRLADGAHGEPATVGRGALRVGQLVLALGRPGAAVTASLGVVSAVGPEWRTWRGGRIDRFVRLDLAIHDGFSGGPLVDAGGRVVGLGTSGLARAAALAVPAATVDRVVDQLLAGGGRLRAGYLGIATQPVRIPEGVRQRLTPVDGRVPEVGLLLVAVEPGGPAERAGVLLGDLLVALDGEPTEDPRDVLALLGPDAVGRELPAVIVRAGAPTALTIAVAEHPGRS